MRIEQVSMFLLGCAAASFLYVVAGIIGDKIRERREAEKERRRQAFSKKAYEGPVKLRSEE
jgi:hypothetical protein